MSDDPSYIAARELDATLAKLREEKTKLEVELKGFKDKDKAAEDAKAKETQSDAEKAKLSSAVLWLLVGVFVALMAVTCANGMQSLH